VADKAGEAEDGVTAMRQCWTGLRRLALPLVLVVGMAATAPDWVLKDNGYRSFLRDLQTAVRSNNSRVVLDLASFPLRVNRRGGSHPYRNRAEAEKDYNRIFTPNVRRVILAQKFDDLFGRDQGVMIGNGEVWFDHICLDRPCRTKGPVRIIAVNSQTR
jgi:hypothetical protein